jgi:uncharacterized membrane protein YfcA
MALRPSPKVHQGEGNDVAGVSSSFAVGIYGGYFGAAQGIILMALLRLSYSENLQVLNAIKNVLAGVANAVAGLLFIVVAHVAWGAAVLIAAGSVVGSLIGARYGRRIPPEILRRVVIVYGVIVAGVLIVT